MPNSKLPRAFAALLFGALLPLASSACNPPTQKDTTHNRIVSAPNHDANDTDELTELADPTENISQSEAAEMGITLGFGSVLEEGEDYILYMDDEGNEQEVLIGWIAPPPSMPPVAQLVGVDATGAETFIEGTIFFTTWTFIQNPPESWDVEYPTMPKTPAAIGENHRTIRLLTDVPPLNFTVIGWDEIVPGKVYSAEESAAIDSYDYTKSHRNPGERVSPEGFVEYYKIPIEVMQHPYIEVIARWSTPPRNENGKLVEVEYDQFPQASWMFYITNE